MTDVLSAISDINYLLDCCREGNFYEDYDESWEMLGAAERSLKFISDLLINNYES